MGRIQPRAGFSRTETRWSAGWNNQNSNDNGEYENDNDQYENDNGGVNMVG